MIGRLVGIGVLLASVLMWRDARGVASNYTAMLLECRPENREVMLPFWTLITRGAALVAALAGILLIVVGW